MKIFEVIQERLDDDNNIHRITEYVSGINLKAVTDHYTKESEELDQDLKAVREVLVVTRHIPTL